MSIIRILLASFIGITPLFAVAAESLDSAETCYNSIKVKYTAGQPSLARFKHAQIATVKSEEFIREIDFLGNNIALGSHYYKRTESLNTGLNVMTVTFSKKDSGLEVEERDVMLNQQSLPIQFLSNKVSYDASCNPTLVSQEIDQIQYPQTDSAVITADTMDGKDPTTSTLPKDQLLIGLYVGDIPVFDIFRSSFVGKGPITLAPNYSVDVKSLASIPMTDSTTGKTDLFKGVQFSFTSYPMTSSLYRSQNSGKQIGLTFLNGMINRKLEWISKQTWLQDALDNDVKILNVSNDDIWLPELKLALSGVGKIPSFPNSKYYFSVMSQNQGADSWQLNVDFQNQNPPPSIPWDAPVKPEDKIYLQSTSMIQTDRVAGIANDIKKRLIGASRIQAASEITKEVTKRLTYNATTKTQMSTDDILKAGNGICYHFSILFASIARELGIPTKMMGGFLIQDANLGAHAWNEIKIDDSNWWPIEPQSDDGAQFRRGYFPTQEISGAASQIGGQQSIEDLLKPSNLIGIFGLKQISKIP